MGPLFLALIPLAILIGAHFMWPKRITLPELAAGAVVSLALGFGMFAIGKNIETSATELWNGQVTATTKTVASYSRSYSCRCRTNSSGYRSCSTCWDHGHDMNWYTESTLGRFRILYRDCSSTNKARCVAKYPDPARWVNTQVGDPVARTNSYQNYVRAADYGLFNRDMIEGSQSRYPELQYPITIYDTYRVDRVLLDGVTLNEDVSAWNAGLSNILRTLGPEKQANMIVVMTDAMNMNYGEMLIDAWEGANKNDIIIIAGFGNGTVDGRPDWLHIHSWAKFDIFNVTLRDELLNNPEWWASADAFFPNVNNIVMEHFERRPMAEFEYLKNEIKPSTGIMIFFSILGAFLGAGMAFLFREVDVFGRESPSWR